MTLTFVFQGHGHILYLLVVYVGIHVKTSHKVPCGQFLERHVALNAFAD